MSNVDSQFQQAVKACPALKLQNGLEALGGNRKKISTKDPKNTHAITGSVNIEECTKPSCHNANHWDYAVGYRRHDGYEKTYFIDVHSAQTSEIKTVVKKAEFLKAWATQNAPDLWVMPREICWVAKGDGVNIRWTDAYRRLLAKAGIDLPKKHLVLT